MRMRFSDEQRSQRDPTHRYSRRPRPTQSRQAAPPQVQVRTGGRARCAAGDLLARSCARGVWRGKRGRRVGDAFVLRWKNTTRGARKFKDSEKEGILDVRARNTRAQRLVHVAGTHAAKGVEAEAAPCTIADGLYREQILYRLHIGYALPVHSS